MTYKIFSLFIFLTVSTTLSAQDQQSTQGAQPDLKGMLLFEYGLNIPINSSADFDVSIFRSRSIEFYFLYPLSLGDTKFSFHPGIGFSAHNYTFSEEVTLSISDSTEIIDLDGGLYPGVDKSKLSAHYFNIPFEFRYFAKENNQGFTAALGGVVGRQLITYTKIKFGDNQHDKFRRGFNVNPWRYGAYARVGFRGIMLTGKYMFSGVFQDEKGPNVNTLTVGLSLSLF